MKTKTVLKSVFLLFIFFFILLMFKEIDGITDNSGSLLTQVISSENKESTINNVNKKVKILIVPGHDNEDYGTVFGKLREADINIELSKYLFDYFNTDGKFEVATVREFEDGEYTTTFSEYFLNHKEDITDFINEKREEMQNLVSVGEIEKNVTVEHNFASPDTAFKLYGINKWANDNDIDLSIHVHFNDYPGRGRQSGKYSGFSIYIPEKQYDNSVLSMELAEEIFRRLELYNHKSNFLLEEDGIIESQELIALGSNGSQNHASVLIEYGYIYEGRFLNEETRDILVREFAYQTYMSVRDYFVKGSDNNFSDTSLLPFDFRADMEFGDESLNVLTLQAALLKSGVYPPDGKSLKDCPLTGLFGACTREAVKAFQEKYKEEILSGIEPTGFVGPKTREKLNNLYGSF